MPFSDTLKELRKNKNISRQQLAEATGISVHSISSYESGRREPNSKAMTALEDYFGVSGTYLRGEANQIEAPFKWDDEESVDAVRDSFSFVLKKLSDGISQCNPKHQKLIFDILMELQYTITKGSDAEKDYLIESLHADSKNAVSGKKKPSAPVATEAEGHIFDRFTNDEIQLFTRFLLFRGIGEGDNISPIQIGMLQSAALILDTAFPAPTKETDLDDMSTRA